MTLGAVFRAVFATADLLSISSVPVLAQQPAAIDSCVPEDLRDDVIGFRAEDDVEVRPAARQRLPRCDRRHGDREGPLRLAAARRRRLQVLLSDIRGLVRDDRKKHFRHDLDLAVGARELDRRGASSIVAASSGTGATVLAASARKLPGLAGVVLLSPLTSTSVGEGGRLNAVAVLETVDLPVLVAVAEDDKALGDDGWGFVAADDAREPAEAASGSRLEVVPGAAHGTQLVKDGERVRSEVLAFVRTVSPVSAFERWRIPVAVGVVALGLVAVVIVGRRRAARSAGSEDDGPGAVSGHETG